MLPFVVDASKSRPLVVSLSFREQTMLEKAKYLVVSEITNADKREYGWLEGEIQSWLSARIESSRPRGQVK